MHVAFILEKVPAPVTGGTGMHVVLASMLQSLRAAGHRVTACFVLGPGERGRLSSHAEDLAAVRALDVAIQIVEVEGVDPQAQAAKKAARLLRQVVVPRLTDCYPSVADAGRVSAAIDRLRPDVIMGHPVTAMAAVHQLRSAPRLIIVGNLDHLVPYEKWRTIPLTRLVPFFLASLRLIAARKQLEFMTTILADADAVAANTVHHAEWLRQHGFPQCQYLPNPIADFAGPDWASRRAQVSAGRPKILMIGNLRGAATVPGLKLFAEQILPRLEDRLGPDGFEVHLVGRDDPPPGLARGLTRPPVLLRGFVEDAGPEFLSADVLLVPTPTELGSRTRITVGASYGCCIVAHQANLAGAPEFVAGRDLLAAERGTDLADAVVRALADGRLRADLGGAARRTFEREFSIESAGRKLADSLERLVRQRPNAPWADASRLTAASQ